MKIENAVVLVSGANRGIGMQFALSALARGARKVYAGARNPNDVSISGVETLQLDVTSSATIALAVEKCRDVNVIVNNAGICHPGSLLAQGGVEAAQEHFETNVLGMLKVMSGFAPVLAANGGGAFLNVLSVASWINSGTLNGYAVSKSAAWGLTNGLRQELRSQGTQVLGLHMGFVDTDMTKDFAVAKVSAASIVEVAYDALEAGASEVLADERAQMIKRGLTADPPIYL